MSEKRLKLGIDTDELANKLVSLNQIIEKNNRDAQSGQSLYNTLLNATNQLLTSELDLLTKVNTLYQQNQQVGSSGGGSSSSNVDLSEVVKLLSSIDSSLENLFDPLERIENNVVDILQNISNAGGGNPGVSPGITPGNAAIGGGGGGGTTGGGQGTGGGINGASIQGATSSVAGIAVQKNEVYMTAALAAVIAGQGAGMVLSRLLSAGEKLDTSRHQYYGVSGEYGLDRDYSDIGLSEAEALERASAYKRANAKTGTSKENYFLEKGLSISGGTVAELSKSIRSDGMSDWTAGDSGNLLLSQLIRKGKVGENEARAYSEEYIQTLIELNKQQLLVTGETNDILNSTIIASIASLGEEFQNPEVLRYVVQGLKSGLMQAATPQVEALQYSSLSQFAPNASLWQLEKMRANPFGEESAQYLPQLLKNIVNISGGGEEAYFNVSSVFSQLKGSPALVEKIVESVKAGTFEKDFGKAKIGKDGKSYFEYDFASEASKATSPMQKLTAGTENVMAEMGIPLIQSIDSTMKEVYKFLGLLGLGSKENNKDLMTLISDEMHSAMRELGISKVLTKMEQMKENSLKKTGIAK